MTANVQEYAAALQGVCVHQSPSLSVVQSGKDSYLVLVSVCIVNVRIVMRNLLKVVMLCVQRCSCQDHPQHPSGCSRIWQTGCNVFRPGDE